MIYLYIIIKVWLFVIAVAMVYTLLLNTRLPLVLT